ncbi:MAG: hypothetical protein C0474_07395, partial [Sphingobium sp.]|nr:hypothetical protein [Sphingobium sp.]
MAESNDVTMLTRSREVPATASNGYVMLLVMLLALAAVLLGVMAVQVNKPLALSLIIGGGLVFLFVSAGFYMLQPNQAAAITMFGAYRGSDRTTGLRWVLPWMLRNKVSLRANNLISEKIKVNDLRGNP